MSVVAPYVPPPVIVSEQAPQASQACPYVIREGDGSRCVDKQAYDDFQEAQDKAASVVLVGIVITVVGVVGFIIWMERRD